MKLNNNLHMAQINIIFCIPGVSFVVLYVKGSYTTFIFWMIWFWSWNCLGRSSSAIYLVILLWKLFYSCSGLSDSFSLKLGVLIVLVANNSFVKTCLMQNLIKFELMKFSAHLIPVNVGSSFEYSSSWDLLMVNEILWHLIFFLHFDSFFFFFLYPTFNFQPCQQALF